MNKTKTWQKLHYYEDMGYPPGLNLKFLDICNKWTNSIGKI